MLIFQDLQPFSTYEEAMDTSESQDNRVFPLILSLEPVKKILLADMKQEIDKEKKKTKRP